MKLKTFWPWLLILLFFLGACNAATATPPLTATSALPAATSAPPTATLPVATKTPAVTLTAQPTGIAETPEAAALTLTPGLTATAPISGTAAITDTCYQLTWLADVTAPDGAVMQPGEIFLKVWEVQNTGTCAWDFSFFISYDYGEQLSGPDIIPVQFYEPGTSLNTVLGDPTWSQRVWEVPPGEIVDIALLLRAPDEPGLYRGVWLISDLEDRPVDFLWVDIKVETGAERSPEDWSGSWWASNPTKEEFDLVALTLEQTENKVFGFFYSADGRVHLVDGEVSADGRTVTGLWGEPQMGDLTFEWQLLENNEQFRGAFDMGLFGSGDWCGVRFDSIGEMPDPCGLQP